MGMTKELKKVDGELQVFMKNIDQALIALAERLHNLYVEHEKLDAIHKELARRVDDLENRSGSGNIH